ncbi:hypothetical protein [Thermococcus sp.]
MRIKCEVLSSCASKLENFLKDAKIEFLRLLEPDPDTLLAYSERIYGWNTVEIVEITDDTSRVFYIFDPKVPVERFGELFSDFVLFFRVRNRDALNALLRVIGSKRKWGKRYKYRSVISFLVSFLGSSLFSSLLKLDNYLLQYLLVLALTMIIYVLLDYPFSLLRLKGVELLSREPGSKKTVRFVGVLKRRREN